MRGAIFIFLCACNSVFGIDVPTKVDASADVAKEAAIIDPSDASTCLTDGEVCSLFPNCGCEQGKTCSTVDGLGTRDCVDVGTTPLYHPCTHEIGDCPFSAECIGGVCKPLCGTNSDCGGGERACIQITQNGYPNGTKIPGLKVCSSGCDPLNSAATCGPGATCRIVNKTLSATTCDCLAPVGNKTGPGGCLNDNHDCADGWVCIISGQFAGDCQKFCRMQNHPEDCPMPTSCGAFGYALFHNGEEYGSCR